MHLHSESQAPNRVLKVALAVTVLLVAGEMAAGYWAHSLALISDAWHNATDLPSMALAWLALYFGSRPPDHKKTYGYHRAGILAAFVNSLTLFAVAAFILFEAYERLMNPVPVLTGVMIGVGALALLVNGGISWALAARSRHDVNMRAIFIHNLGDAASNVGVILGALFIRYTGQDIVDPVLSVLISGMIVWSAWGILRETANILLEGLPKGLHLETVAHRMLTVPGVQEVHDIHIWSLGSRNHALSCHVLIHDMVTSESERILYLLRELLAQEFEITHCTIQFEHTHPPGETHWYMPEPLRADPPKNPS